jgi:hypothetical protein
VGRTANPIEISWSAVAAIGVLFTFWMIIDAYLDYLAVQTGVRGGYAKARGARWWIASGALIGNGLTLLVWAGFLVVGGMAIFDLWEEWAGWILIGMEALLATIQIWSRIVRYKVAGRPHVPRVPRSTGSGGLS